jgi:hypothetical protein
MPSTAVHLGDLACISVAQSRNLGSRNLKNSIIQKKKKLSRASSALRSEFIPFQFIRKEKEFDQLLALVDF